MKPVNAILITLSLSLSGTAFSANEKTSVTLSCGENMSLNLNPAEYFALSLCAVTKANNGAIPSRLRDVQKLILGAEATGDAPIEKILDSYLNGLKISYSDWTKLSDVVLPKDIALGSSEFNNLIQFSNLGADVIASLMKINKVAYDIRVRVRKRLVELEEQSLTQKLRFLTEDELNGILSNYTRNPDLNIRNLRYAIPAPGKSNISAWRDALFTDNPKIRDRVKAQLSDEFVRMVIEAGEIPGSKLKFVGDFRARLNLTEVQLADFFGKGKLFNSVEDFIDSAKSANVDALKFVIDRRIYSEEREQNMLDAIKKNGSFLAFKLIENADLPAFSYLAAYSKLHSNMPMIASPAFTQLNLVPDQLGDAFNNPNLYIQTKEQLQISKDFYLLNNGAADKNKKPLTGVSSIVKDPTAKVLVYSPMIQTQTNPNAYYGLKVGYQMTTGSMSDPAFDAAYLAGIKTDQEAAGILEKTLGFTVVSRQYHNPNFPALMNSADGIGARRVFWTSARYGNPAGLFDLNTITTLDKVVKIKSLPALVWGDLHWGATDPEKLRAVVAAMQSLWLIKKNPNFGQYGEYEYIPGDVGLGALVLHDTIDGTPFNDHMKDAVITMSKADMKKLLGIVNHIQSAVGFVNQLHAILPDTSIVITMDNHGYEWLGKMLQKLDLRGYNRDDYALIFELASEAINTPNYNTYQRIFEKFGVNTDKVVFMNKGEHYRVGVDPYNPGKFSVLNDGVNVAPHGQSGINGSKSISLNKIFESYGPSANGHYHTTAENGGSSQVATLTPDVQDYHNGGPSKGDTSIELVFSDEARQILRLENGSFVPNAPVQDEKLFFTTGLPAYKERPSTVGGAQNADQFINPTHPKGNLSRKNQK